MRNGKASIADIVGDDLPEEELPKNTETTFEEERKFVYHAPVPYITQKIIKHSFGFITKASQVNKILMVFVGILFCVAIIILVRASKPLSKVPIEVLHLNMERMRSK